MNLVCHFAVLESSLCIFHEGIFKIVFDLIKLQYGILAVLNQKN